MPASLTPCSATSNPPLFRRITNSPPACQEPRTWANSPRPPGKGLTMAITVAREPSAQGKRPRFDVKTREALIACIWIAPAVAFVVVFLLYPVISTLWTSLFNFDSSEFIGLANFQKIFTSPGTLIVLRNNLIWLVLGTVGTVALGLIIAVLVDRVRIESFAKAAIFIPMAISFVGAGVIWKFIYDYNASGNQIGLLNAFITRLGF